MHAGLTNVSTKQKDLSREGIRSLFRSREGIRGGRRDVKKKLKKNRIHCVGDWRT